MADSRPEGAHSNRRRRRGAWTRAGVLLVIAAAIAPAPALGQPTAPTGVEAARQADEHFLRGKELLKNGDVQGAYTEYKAAWELKKSFDIAANLGNLELELGKPRDAAEHLAFSVRNYAVTATTQDRLEKTRKRLEEARQRVGAVNVTVSVEGAEVLIDGASVGRSPIAEELYVDPGTRVIEARLAGYLPAKQTIEAGRNSTQSVTLALTPAPTPPKGGERPAKKSMAPIGVGIGVAIAGLGLGITGVALSAARGSDIDALKGELTPLGTGACLAKPQPAQCASLDNAYIDQGSFRNLGIAGFAIAGAAAIGTITYVLLPAPKPAAPAVKASFGAGPGGGTLLLQGTF